MENNTQNNSSPEFDKLIKNMAEISGKFRQIYSICQKNQSPDLLTEQWSYFISNYQDYTDKIKLEPTRLIDIYVSYTQDYFSLLENTFHKWHEITQTELPYPQKDKRFNDTLWQEHPLFNFVSQFYLLLTKHVNDTVDAIDGLDDKHKQKLAFHIKQTLDALAPSNFVLTNPSVIQSALDTSGENLVTGLNNFIKDLEQNNGKLHIKMTDFEAFKLGENIANTPGKIIFQNELMQLIQYQPKTETTYKKPLLIIPPWINKYYILDLSQENSLVLWLLKQGYTVFIISWVNPDTTHADMDFENYMQDGLLTAVDIINKITDESSVNAIGYCIGGTLLATTLAYLAEKKEKKIASATYFATMLDFSEPGNIGVFIDQTQIQMLENHIEKHGYLDGYILFQIFNLLRANDLIWSYFIKNYLQGDKPIPLDILYWNSDYTNLPKKMTKFYLHNMYLNNKLVGKEGINLLKTSINLRSIKTPTYFVSTQQDHIAPWQSTYAGMLLHSGPTKFILGGSGHIAGIINPPAKNKYHYFIADRKYAKPDTFLKNAKQHAGSWWPHWETWLRQKSGTQVKARTPGQGKFPAIEDAPGSYVKKQLRG